MLEWRVVRHVPLHSHALLDEENQRQSVEFLPHLDTRLRPAWTSSEELLRPFNSVLLPGADDTSAPPRGLSDPPLRFALSRRRHLAAALAAGFVRTHSIGTVRRLFRRIARCFSRPLATPHHLDSRVDSAHTTSRSASGFKQASETDFRPV